MKSLYILLLSIVLFSFTLNAAVHVRGYTRKDGTYVRAHTRSAPNHTVYDNYSYRRNVPDPVTTGNFLGAYYPPTEEQREKAIAESFEIGMRNAAQHERNERAKIWNASEELRLRKFHADRRANRTLHAASEELGFRRRYGIAPIPTPKPVVVIRQPKYSDNSETIKNRFKCAYRDGLPTFQYELGMNFLNGTDGVRKDTTTAIRLLTVSAEQGNQQAVTELMRQHAIQFLIRPCQ